MVQCASAWTSWFCYLMGMWHAYNRNFAIHKDFMVGSILFATVPIGFPRFIRDLTQLQVGSDCDVAEKPEFNFFVCCLLCIFGWPGLFLLAGRWSPFLNRW